MNNEYAKVERIFNNVGLLNVRIKVEERSKTLDLDQYIVRSNGYIMGSGLKECELKNYKMVIRSFCIPDQNNLEHVVFSTDHTKEIFLSSELKRTPTERVEYSAVNRDRIMDLPFKSTTSSAFSFKLRHYKTGETGEEGSPTNTKNGEYFYIEFLIFKV